MEPNNDFELSVNEYMNLYVKKVQCLNNDFFGYDSREELHWGKMFLNIFGEFYSVYRYTINISCLKVVDDLTTNFNLNSNQIIKIQKARKANYSGREYDSSEYLLIPCKSIMICVHEDGMLVYYGHNIQFEKIMEIKAIAERHWVKKINKKSFQMITMKDRELALTEFDLPGSSIDVDQNYNDDFIEVDQIIKKSINEYGNKGLILLHGIPGTGKTSYIRHLIGSIENKQFIYLPNYLIDSLNSPNFLPFISEHQNSILILEDCESALMQRDNYNIDITALSTLLNLGDGLLGDALSLQVICTFNANLKKIDDALLRKGRLIARYEFKELELLKSQQLADKLGKDVIIDKPLTLAEIYNIESKGYANQKMRKVGFCVGV